MIKEKFQYARDLIVKENYFFSDRTAIGLITIGLSVFNFWLALFYVWLVTYFDIKSEKEELELKFKRKDGSFASVSMKMPKLPEPLLKEEALVLPDGHNQYELGFIERDSILVVATSASEAVEKAGLTAEDRDNLRFVEIKN